MSCCCRAAVLARAAADECDDDDEADIDADANADADAGAAADADVHHRLRRLRNRRRHHRQHHCHLPPPPQLPQDDRPSGLWPLALKPIAIHAAVRRHCSLPLLQFDAAELRAMTSPVAHDSAMINAQLQLREVR